MKHYLVYHSVERMGTSFRDREETEDGDEPFSVVTKKNLRVSPDDVVWLISGEKPDDGGATDYRLEYWFFVEGKRSITDPTFAYQIYGKRGTSFPDGIPLSGLQWFQDYREDQLNFRGGMHTLGDPILRHLYAVVRRAERETPTEGYR